MSDYTLHALRRDIPGPWAPTRSQCLELAIALAEAADNATRDGRPATAGSYRDLRHALNAVLDVDPLEVAWRASLDERPGKE